MRQMFGPMNEFYRDGGLPYRAELGSGRIGTDFQMRGIPSGTRIATIDGWRRIDMLAVGDHVLTFDNGARAIVAITRSLQYAQDGAPEFADPIHVPAGAVGNSQPMVLLPEQNVMIESDEAEARTGDPFALIPAKALVGYRGIERFRALRPFEVLTLHFETDELVYAEGGALLLTQSTVPGDVAALDEIGQPDASFPYVTYKGRDAAALVADLIATDTNREPYDPGPATPLRVAA